MSQGSFWFRWLNANPVFRLARGLFEHTRPAQLVVPGRAARTGGTPGERHALMVRERQVEQNLRFLGEQGRSLLLIGVLCLALLALAACSARGLPTPTPGHPDTPAPSPTSTRPDTPAPSPTSCCPEVPDPTVTIQVEPVSLGVGDTLTIVPSVSGYAYPVSVDLFIDTVHIARLGWQDGQDTRYETVPILEVVSVGGGERAFVLEAAAAGEASIEVSAYGDAEFCHCVDGRPSAGTTFKIARSEPVSVTISPPEPP